MTSRHSPRDAQHLTKWKDDFLDASDSSATDEDRIMILLANKCDVSDSERQVSLDALDDWWHAQWPDAKPEIFQTSALDGSGVQDAFERLAALLLQKSAKS